MKAGHVKTPKDTEEVSLHAGQKRGERSKKRGNTPLWKGKAENELAKRLANLWRRVNITKKAHAGRGQELKWEIPGDESFPDCSDRRRIDPLNQW
jgi:hypothetical protein